jgi:hypothetical protein
MDEDEELGVGSGREVEAWNGLDGEQLPCGCVGRN